METYIQQTADFSPGKPASNCIVCHKNATIAGCSGFASDYSFIFGLASGLPPAQAKAVPSRRSRGRPWSTRQGCGASFAESRAFKARESRQRQPWRRAGRPGVMPR
jgi:hypothetical protein